VVLIASELASNAVLHSRSRSDIFAVGCQVFPHHVRIEVADLGGQWRRLGPDGRPHGLDIVASLATGWGIEQPVADGCRVVWARVEFPPGGTDGHELMTRREVAYTFRVTSATVANWARRTPAVLAEVRDEQGRPRYRRADVEELYLSGFRGERRHG